MVAQCALEQFKLDKVIFVPTGTPPHKKTDVLDKESRFEMVAAAVRDNPRFEASRIEIDRPGITYSIDTLKELKQSLGDGVRLNFIIGEDNIKSLENYARADEILSLCRLLVSPRPRQARHGQALAHGPSKSHTRSHRLPSRRSFEHADQRVDSVR